MTEELKNEAIAVWCNYGKAINEAFGIKGGLIIAEPLNTLLETNEEEKVKAFINYISVATNELKEME